jgi:hypothetical protein
LYNSYVDNGVIITPNVVAHGDKATVIYRGILKKSGAESVYMHVGYGEKWESSDYVQMKRTNEGFEAVLPVTSHDKLNMAFKDSADNWDNNAGSNYSFVVEPR